MPGAAYTLFGAACILKRILDAAFAALAAAAMAAAFSRDALDVVVDWNEMLMPLSRDPTLPRRCGFSLPTKEEREKQD